MRVQKKMKDKEIAELFADEQKMKIEEIDKNKTTKLQYVTLTLSIIDYVLLMILIILSNIK